MKALLRHMYRWAATAIAVCGLSLSCQKADDTPVEPEEPTTYEVQVEDFSTTRETMHIGGKLYLPKGRKGPGPAAIFCHGLFGSRNEQEVYARCAARVGIIAVAFDFCGGPAEGSLSDGTPADNSVLTEIEDLKAVYMAITARPDVDPSRIIVSGNSQGGLVASLFAVRNPGRVMALNLLYPAFNLPDMVRTALDVLYDGDIDKMPESLGVGNYSFSKKYVRDAMDLYPFEEIRKFAGPVEILQGDLDPFVTPETSEKAAAIFPNANLIVLKDQGHPFDLKGRKEASEYLETWFREVI